MSLKKVFTPSRYQLILMFFLVLASTIIINDVQATTKVTYDVSRGIPFTVLVMDECRTVCEPSGFIIPGRLKEFNASGLFLNALIVGLIVVPGGNLLWLVIPRIFPRNQN